MVVSRVFFSSNIVPENYFSLFGKLRFKTLKRKKNKFIDQDTILLMPIFETPTNGLRM